MFKFDLEKTEEKQIKLPTEKVREFQNNNIYFHFIDYVKASDLDHNKHGKFLKKWGYQTTLPAS